MKILRASYLGMCFGVRDAITLAKRQEQPTTIVGELVHNESVLRDLRAHGIKIQQRPEQIATDQVMITAHGASQKRMRALTESGHKVIEATCPLVRVAHRALDDLVSKGYFPVVIGQPGHVEVVGLTEDYPEFEVIARPEEVATMVERAKFGIVAQTTQPVLRVRRLVDLIRSRFPASDVRWVDTVCQPTKLRQEAAAELAAQCDAVIVIGGLNSNNTRELVQTCHEFCSRVYHVQSAQDLHGTWLAGTATIGITAGTSTPDHLVDEVEHWLRDFARFQAQLVRASPAENEAVSSSSSCTS